MIKDAEFWERWKAQQTASEPPDFERNWAIMEAMYERARLLGVFETSTLCDRIESERLEHKIRLARALGGLRPSDL